MKKISKLGFRISNLKTRHRAQGACLVESEIRNPKSEIAASAHSASRRGSVLIVVIGLLLLLMLVGFTFFTFSSQEHSSAEYYADSAKVYNIGISSDALFDWALEQLIIGPTDNYQQSVLTPGRHSLVPNMLGMFASNPNNSGYPTVPTDRHPFNGGFGVNVIGGTNGQPYIDQNFDGQADLPLVGNPLLTINFMRGATGPAQVPFTGNVPPNQTAAQARAQIFQNFPQIDVGYTYPDINNLFQAFIGTDATGSTTVITPSFHRPQFLRDPVSGLPISDWYQNQNSAAGTDTRARILRAHPGHLCVADNSTPRYIRLGDVCINAQNVQIAPFPFMTNINNQTVTQQGVWDLVNNGYGYDADNDGDGNIREGVWLDLDFPFIVLSDGRKMIPMFSYTVLDADSLINLNLAGNLAGFASLQYHFSGSSLAPVMSGNTPISRSNLGVSPTEQNPEWALTADPNNTLYLSPINSPANPASSLQQYRAFFQQTIPAAYSPDRVEMSNMDMLFILWGRPKYTVTANGNAEVAVLSDYNLGRWGDSVALQNGANSGNPAAFPRPGQWNVDDDYDLFAGIDDNDSSLENRAKFTKSYLPFSQNTTIPPISQPMDFFGQGKWTVSGPLYPKGSQPQLFNMFGPAAALQYGSYQGAALNFDANIFPASLPPFDPTYIPYQAAMWQLGPSQSPPSVGNVLTPNPDTVGLIDEGDEVVVDSRFPQPYDQIYGVDELFGLQASQGDYQAALGQSRLRGIASWNFESNNLAAAIRKRFTTSSWDRRQHGFAMDARTGQNRFWEYNLGNWDLSGQPQFPPQVFPPNSPTWTINNDPIPANVDTPTGNFKAAEPFRVELAALIGAKQNNATVINNAANNWVVNNVNAFKTPAYDYRTIQNPQSPWQQQLRLNVNRFLTTTDPTVPFGMNLNPVNGFPNSQNNPLQYRQLTPHPTQVQWQNWQQQQNGNDPTQPIPTVSPTGSFDTDAQNFPNNPPLQEYWARRDRQQMARDIYVMLYMFGGGYETEDFNQNGQLDAGEDLNGNGKLDLFVNYAAISNTMTGGTDPYDTSPTPTLKARVLYNDSQLREMAQFAVNYVDALDRDDTITVFEYDRNLGDGWNLDDNPFTTVITSPADPISANDRDVVYGVEMQSLVLSEALAFKHKKSPLTDIAFTPFDDRTAERYFAYIELCNVSPFDLRLDSSAGPAPKNINNGDWRLQLFSGDPANAPPRNLKFKRDGLAASNVIQAGGRYVISNAALATGATDMIGSVARGSDFRISCFDNGAHFDLIAPNVFESNSPDQNTPRQPQSNLDLVQDRDYGASNGSNDNNNFTLTDSSGTVVSTRGGFMTPTNPVTGIPANTTFAIVLQRRLNLSRMAPANDTDPLANGDNPWITVDQIGTINSSNVATAGISLKDSQITSTITQANIGQTIAAALASQERKWLLDGTTGNFLPSKGEPNPVPQGEQVTPAQSPLTPNGPFATNTLARRVNSVSASSTTIWQPHFDRDFSSVMELLSVPLYGPDQLTQGMLFNGQMAPETPTVPTFPVTYGQSNYQARVAEAKFFRPQHPSNVALPSGKFPNQQYDNRWYRVLELLEVPTRENMQIENFLLQQYPWLAPQALQRIAARMNLNTMRNGENLFALLDDNNQFDIQNGYNISTGSYNDRLEGGRDWWYQMVTARDALDPVANLYLPGAAGSHPFRSFSFLKNNPLITPPSLYPTPAYELSGLDDTLLRMLPGDVATVPGPPKVSSPFADARRLFEARTQADLGSQGGVNSIDYYTRNRLISKIAGNTTPRSNVFIVWISVGFFEAFQPDPVNTPNVVRIGGELTDTNGNALPHRRGFFVVDRSLLEDAWVADPSNQGNGYYDFRKFIQYRKTIQ